MAETTTAHGRVSAATSRATCSSRPRSATDEPPNFMTIMSRSMFGVPGRVNCAFNCSRARFAI